MENVIEIKNVTKNYSDFKLDNININIKKGFITGFIGPNGAGKSTTIKLIMNLIRKDSGLINIFGLDNTNHDREIKSRIGFVYDECCFYENLKIISNEKVISAFYKDWDHKKFISYLKRFELNPNKRVKRLSKGMKTKFAIAIALSHNADLLIMDEPTAGLDPIFRRELLDILYDLIQDENKSIFFSTHITSDLDKIADYITFINKGQIVFSKSTDVINDNYKIIKGNKELLSEIDKQYIIGINKNRYGFDALTTNSSKLIEKYQDSICIENANLEDIMVYYIKKGEL
ncbi:ABC transporter ATP-binding protein [Vallitalea longa]|uniref:ABC transporter ATP-binding protein n=1 Tax=Vallitalea longa TaxID=2936439 RepID=A0A9W6DFN4_9FIRM|nr:ABC transporter ATP-binding protein [Vallitalea longa]GKX31426.1 ABC transporter ATP-binding protein [Vallitalea longa]